VGEQGAELVRLPTGSTVIPHGQSMNMLNQMGGGGPGGEALVVEWVGPSGDDFFELLRKHIRFKRGRGPNSVQQALGS
jgi:hypothetical protein